MRYPTLVLVLLASLARAQWPQTIDLDTLDGLAAPCAVAYNATNHRAYVSGRPSSIDAPNLVSVLDCRTLELVAAIPRLGVAGNAISFNPNNNKIYVVEIADNAGYLGVIDGSADSLVTNIDVGNKPRGLCVNPLNNKVYCASRSWDRVAVIDGEADTLVEYVPVGDEPRALCCNAIDNKVYCSNNGGPGSWYDSTVTVIDGTTNQVLRTVQVGVAPTELCHNPVENKVYVANSGGWGAYPVDSTVSVLDGVTDSVLSTFVVGLRPQSLVYNPRMNAVYCWCMESVVRDSGHIAVIDCSADTVLTWIPAGGAMMVDTTVNKLYVALAPSDSVFVIDCSTNTVIGRVYVGAYPVGLARDTTTLLFCTNQRGDDVAVLDVTTDSVIERVHLGLKVPLAIGGVPGNDAVYCAHEPDMVSVIDSRSNSIVSRLRVGRSPKAFQYVPTNGLLYCACPGLDDARPDSTLSIIDPARNEVVSTVTVGRAPVALCYSTASQKLYVANRVSGTIAVVDTRADSILAVVPVDSYPSMLACNPSGTKIYVGCDRGGWGARTNSLVVLDGEGDTVRTTHRVAANGPGQCLFLSPEANKAYFAYYDYASEWLLTVDGTSDSVIGLTPAGVLCPTPAAYDPRTASAWLGGLGGVASEVDCYADTVLRTIAVPLCNDFAQVRLGMACNRLYCTSPVTDKVGVIDVNTGVVVGHVNTGRAPVPIHLCETNELVYVGNTGSGKLTVFPFGHVGIQEQPAFPRRRSPVATVVRGNMYLPKHTGRQSLLSLSGRKVMDLQPGPNDIRHLSPGIYFVREESARTTRKVIVTR